MADLEHHAFKRDRRYLVRLTVLLLIGVLGGSYIYGKMTSTNMGSCAADMFGATEDEPAADGNP